VLRWWSPDAPATVVDGRVTDAPDVVAGAVATRFGQGRVGPELLQVDGRPAWRFGGSASPASLLTPDVPAINGAPYAWVVVLAPLAGYAGQVLAPGPNSTVTSSSAQLLAGTTGSFRWEAFAGATTSLPMPAGEHLVVLEHDGGTGSTRLYATGQGSVRATLQRRSLAGQQHIGRHGSNDRPLHADVRALVLLDHGLSDAEVQVLEQWRAEGARSRQDTARLVVARSTSRSASSARTAPRRATPATTTARSRAIAAATGRRLAPAPSSPRSRATAAASTRRAAAAPVAARSRSRATATARRSAAAATAARSAATALSAPLRAVGARMVTTTAAAAATAPLRATRARTVTRSTSAAVTRPQRLVEALARSWSTAAALVRALVARPTPTSTSRDLLVDVGPPLPGWLLGRPESGWQLDPPAAGWRLGPPTDQPGGGTLMEMRAGSADFAYHEVRRTRGKPVGLTDLTAEGALTARAVDPEPGDWKPAVVEQDARGVLWAAVWCDLSQAERGDELDVHVRIRVSDADVLRVGDAYPLDVS
jgi:hypothetical protein